MKPKILLFISILIFSVIHVYELKAETGEIPVDPVMLHHVVKIESFSDKLKQPIYGTGFIVSRDIKEGKVSKAYFLVTNKHMLSDWTLADGNIKKINKFITIYFYRKDFSPDHPISAVKLDLRDKKTRKIATANITNSRIQYNSDPLVDVAVVVLDRQLVESSGLDISSFDVSYLLPFDKITSFSFNIGSQVFVLGYPSGITSLRNNYPIAKFGYIASMPGDEFSIKLNAENRKGEIKKNTSIKGKLLIIDGLIVPGNSGGPVILPSVIKTRIDPITHNYEHMTEPSKNLVIGILSGGFGNSGLSYVYCSDYIVETIDEALKRFNIEPASLWWPQIKESIVTKESLSKTD